MKLKIVKSFRYASDGVHITDYPADTEIDTDDRELMQVAVREGWAVEAKDAAAKRESKAHKAAPENRAAEGATEA